MRRTKSRNAVKDGGADGKKIERTISGGSPRVLYLGKRNRKFWYYFLQQGTERTRKKHISKEGNRLSYVH